MQKTIKHKPTGFIEHQEQGSVHDTNKELIKQTLNKSVKELQNAFYLGKSTLVFTQ